MMTKVILHYLIYVLASGALKHWFLLLTFSFPTFTCSSWFQITSIIQNCPKIYQTSDWLDWWLVVGLFFPPLFGFKYFFQFAKWHTFVFFRVSCDRTLMRQPVLRLGIIIYWTIMHALLAFFVVWGSWFL